MYIRTCRLFIVLLLLVAHAAYANEVKIRTCGWGIMNALNRLEVKGATALEIIEYKIDKPIDYIFGEHKLVLAPLESRFKEQIALFRRPGFSRAVSNNAFSETRFISDVPSQKFTSLLEDNTLYTYTIQDKKITFAKTKPGLTRNLASKHGLLSSDQSAGPLRMAGELWKDEKGILHFDPGSGTFKPGSEDLKRAEVFFKQHMGITDAVPHYFTPPVIQPTVAVVPQSTLSKTIKEINYAQKAITAKRWLVSGIKMSVVSPAGMKNMQAMESEVITLKDPQGKDVQYQFRQIETMVKEETYFDTIDLKLSKNSNQLRTSKTFELSNEKNILKDKLNENDHAVKSARKSGLGNEPIIPVVKVRKEIVQLALYPVNVPKGKKASPVFIMSLETKQSSGLVNQLKDKGETEYLASIEDLSTGEKTREKELEQLSNQIQNRFGLTSAPKEKNGMELVTALETNVGQ